MTARSIIIQVAVAIALIALVIAALPVPQTEKMLTINDRAVWGYDEAGNLVNKPLPPIEIDLK
jgi:hypothetical protein